MNKYLFSVLICASSFSLAQSPDDLFREANNAYNNGEYDRAIVYYDSILAQGIHAAALYYNLGNAHYKRNAIAPSILNYERALLLDPTNKDVRNNLAFAQNIRYSQRKQMVSDFCCCWLEILFSNSIVGGG